MICTREQKRIVWIIATIKTVQCITTIIANQKVATKLKAPHTTLKGEADNIKSMDAMLCPPH
jgi:hypothetical protein